MTQVLAREVRGASSAAERLLFAAERRSNRNGALNIPIIACMRSLLDRPAMRAALCAVVRRHEALRTRMEWRRGKLIRIVSPDWTPELKCVDLSSAADPAAALEQALHAELTTTIPSAAWPVRASIFTLAPAHHVLCVNMPHRVTDAVTNKVVMNDLATFYRKGCGEAVAPPKPVQWQYSKWVEWQASLLDERASAKRAEEWRKRLDGAAGPQFPNVAPFCELTRRTGYEFARIDAEVMAGAMALAKQERATLFSVFLAALYATVHHRTQQTDLTITTVFSDRNRREVLATAGYFVRILALRTRFKPSFCFTDLIRACRTTLFEALQYQTVPFHTLRGLDNQNGSAPLDHAVMQMMEDPTDFPPPFEVHDRRPDFGGGRTFDLELVVLPMYGTWYLHVLYGTDRFERAFVRELIDDFSRIMRGAVCQPMRRICDLGA